MENFGPLSSMMARAADVSTSKMAERPPNHRHWPFKAVGQRQKKICLRLACPPLPPLPCVPWQIPTYPLCETHYISGLMLQVSWRLLGGLSKNQSFFWVWPSHPIFFFSSLSKLSVCFAMEKNYFVHGEKSHLHHHLHWLKKGSARLLNFESFCNA